MLWRRIFPEGVPVVLLLLLVNLIPALATQESGWRHLVTPVAAISLIGFACGWLMARAGVLDSVSHIVSVIVGTAVSIAFVIGASESFGPGWFGRVRPVLTHIRDWYLGVADTQANDDVVLSLLLGLIVWMLSYLSAWVLFRRGWLLMALILPALLLLVNLGYAPDPEDVYTVLFVVLAIPLAARYHLHRKQVTWGSRLSVDTPRLGARYLLIGTTVAVLVASLGWNVPASVSQEALKPFLGEVGQQVESVRQRADDFLNRRSGGSRESGNAWSDFEEDFSIGGDASSLSDEPEVVVSAESAPYLAAQRYNVYSGRGWSTDVEETFDPRGPNGDNYAPAMYFSAGQEVTLSDGDSADRLETSAAILPLAPPDGVMFTIDTYIGASIDSAVYMSWVQLNDATFSIDEGSLESLPPDLVNIALLLRSVPLIGPEDEFGPLTGDDAADQRILRERAALAERFLRVAWEADEDGNATVLHVDGQLPVYDDVESVSPRQSIGRDGYSVSGLASTATPDQLAGASSDYPDWVSDRYLQLPENFSARTAGLALELTAGDDNPYDKAKSIEAYLRENITYDLTVGAPPDDQDVVEYLLFENPRGYCEHYATAMAVMLRSLGVPARIVGGYAPGTWDDAQGAYVYLQSDAHAWVEVFFPGYGWIPFEPTASEAVLNQGELEPRASEQDLTPEATEPADSQRAEPTEDVSPSTPAAGTDAAPPVTPVEADGGDGGSARWVITAVLGTAAAAIVVLGGGWWLWMRRLRDLPASSSLFVRLLRLGRMVGVRPGRATTPQEFADSLSARLPVTSEPARRIVYAYELDQYGPRGSSGTVLDSAVRAWRHVRSVALPALLRRLVPGRRTR